MGRRLHRFLKSEQLESRRPLAADLAALDVNDDMCITALDALMIINAINQKSSDTVSTAEAESDSDLLCDTNSDGVVTPVDVLNVVNQINSGVVDVPVTLVNDTTSDVAMPDDSGSTTEEVPPTDLVSTSPDPNADITDPADLDDDNADDSTDLSDPTDESNDDDLDDVVNDPTDDSSDDSSDDSTDDTTDEDTDDSTDETDDDTNDDTDTGCDHGNTAATTSRGIALVTRIAHGRGDIFARLDANGDGALSSDEVPSALWSKLVAADADSSDSVTQAEITAYREAQRVAAVEAVFEQLDTDASGSITSADVSRLTWRFLSRADANSDGAITIDELLATPLPGRLGGR